MKKFFSNILALACAGLAFTACTNEPEAVVETAETFTISFDAEVVDPSTKATLTPNQGETAFAAAWEIGDTIELNTSGETFTASWDGSSFVATVPVTLLDATVNLTAEYPYEADPETLSYIDESRTQEGSIFNSFYDVMSGTLEGVKLSKDARFVIPMERETSILYFHLTSEQDVTIESATLTYGDDQITTTYTGLSSSDATLWFNVIPGSYPMSLEINAAGNKTASISTKGTSVEYAKGKLYKIVKEIEFEESGAPYEVYTFGNFTSGTEVNLNADNFTITLKNNGGTNPAWVASAEEARVYAKGSVVVSSERDIKKIVYDYAVNANKNGIAPTVDGVIGKTDNGKWNADSKTWAGSDKEVTLSTSGSAGNLGFKSITVFFEDVDIPEEETYSVNIDPSIEHGSVTANPSSNVKPGTEITLTATSDEDFDFDSWNVTNASTSEVITVDDNKFTMPAADVNVSATFKEKQIPTFASLEELAAADLASGTEVNVSFENVPIKEIYVTNNGYRNGIYFDIQKGENDIELYFQNVPAAWVKGGTVSGTLTKCPWKLYKGTWELAPASGWSWTNLDYTAPVVLAAPAITTHPINAAYVLNESAKNLTVVASGNPSPTYQWYSNTSNSNENGTVLTGETGTSYKPSTSAVGTFYYYCVATNSEGSATSNVATITVNEPATASLPFSFDGGKGDIANTDGMSQTGLGSDYSSSPKLKFDDQGDNVIINFNSAATRVTYTIKGNSTSGTYAFDVMESADGIEYTIVHSHTSITDAKSYTDALKSSTRFVKFVYTTKASGNVALGKISISNEGVTTKYTLTITPATNGSIAATVDGTAVVSGAQIEEGKTVTITATPVAGYKVKSVLAKKTVSGEALTVTDNKFTMPGESVTISAEFELNSGDNNVVFTLGSGKEISSNEGATKDGITITAIDGSSYDNNWGTASYVKLQAGGAIVITPASVTITKIVMTCTSGYERTWSASEGDVPSVDTNNHIVTWTGSTTSAITLTNTANAQARIQTIKVTYQ